jgi:hypothetical protein
MLDTSPSRSRCDNQTRTNRADVECFSWFGVVVNRKAACCDQCVIQARRRVECSGGKPVEPFIESTDPRHVERLTGFAQAYIKEQSRSALLLLRELFAKAFDLLV